MQISKLYETKITCSNYNPNIDDTITVTVALIDFNGNNVTGTNATITVNQGYFTKYTRNGSDTNISGTSTKSYTGTTGTDGTFTMTYKCSEWGLATFSANNSKIQTNVTGWRDITSQLTLNSAYTVKLLINGELKLARLTYSRTSWTVHSTTSSNIGIPSTYRPKGVISQMRTGTIRMVIDPDDGNLVGYNYGSESSTLGSFSLQFDYSYK